MKNVILSACTLLLVLLFSSSVYAGNPLKYLEGKWLNEKTSSTFVAKIDIKFQAYKLYARFWGKCQPTDCNWGWRKGTIKDHAYGSFTINLAYKRNGKITSVTMKPLGETRMKVITKVVYINSNRKPVLRTAYFKKLVAFPTPYLPNSNQTKL